MDPQSSHKAALAPVRGQCKGAALFGFEPQPLNLDFIIIDLGSKNSWCLGLC